MRLNRRVLISFVVAVVAVLVSAAALVMLEPQQVSSVQALP